MKKTFFKNVAGVIISVLSINICCAFGTNRSDKKLYATGSMILQSSNPSNILNDDFVLNTRGSQNLYNYFSNLTDNLGDNPSENCVSVACGMIASYFDTYFNDNIVPENYDVVSECFNYDYDCFDAYSSPGIFSELPSNCLNNDLTINYPVYYNYLNNNNDLVYELIGVDIDNNNRFAPVYHNNTASPLAYAIASRLGNVTPQNFSFNVGYLNTLAQCKEAIDDGYPVFLRIYNGTTDHAVVAFAYDEDDNLYYHTGYKLDNDFGYSMIDYRDISWAFIISPDVNSQHVCSNNYYSIDPITNQITYYCPCMLNGASYPGHTHTINHQYDYDFDEDNHVVISAEHIETCQSCDLTKINDCAVIGLTHDNLYEHTIHFECGNSLSEDCYVTDFQCVGTDIHEGFCICGSLGYEHHNWCLPVLINDQIDYICICGLIYYDHDGAWRDYIREYLRYNDYIDENFLNELINELYNNPF